MSEVASASSLAPAALVEVAAAAATQCWRCRGAGTRVVKTTPVHGEHRSIKIACTTCSGRGVMPARSRIRTGPRPEKQFPGWRMVGPLPQPDASQSEALRLRPDEDLTYLLGHWRIFQAHAAHRYSTDDVVTAWVAWRASSSPSRCLDLGCGIGSVLLMTAWLHPHAHCTGVEAQPARLSQAVRSIAYNGVGDRVAAIAGDLRDGALLPDHVGMCDVVTGTPPYFNVAEGAMPPHEESSRCLFEYRGGIEAYAIAAARYLARPHGLFVVVESAIGVMRGYEAARAAGLRVLVRLDAVPRAGKPVLFCVFVMGLPDAADAVRSRFTAADFVPHGQSPYHATEDVYVAPTAAVGEASGASAAAAASSTDEDEEPAAADVKGPKRKKARPVIRVHPGSVEGELVVSITVRGVDGVRTTEYAKLLREMGKPS